MSEIERPIEYIDDYWGGDPCDLKEHAKFILHGYIMQNERVGIVAASFAYDLMMQAAEEITKLHARIEELEKKFKGQIDLCIANNRFSDALVAVLDAKLKRAKRYIDTLETLFADFGGGTDTHMMAVLDEWEKVNKKVRDAQAKYYNPSPAEDTDG